MDAIAPVAGQAYPFRGTVMLEVQTGESYSAFLQRATATARTAAQNNFNRDRSISDLAITVMGQNQGATVQVLTLRADRNQWRSNSDVRRLATYYPAQTLLGLDRPAPTTMTTAATPTGTTQPGVPRQPVQIQVTPDGRILIPVPVAVPRTAIVPIPTGNATTNGTGNRPTAPGSPTSNTTPATGITPPTGITPAGITPPTGIAPSADVTPSNPPSALEQLFSPTAPSTQNAPFSQ